MMKVLEKESRLKDRLRMIEEKKKAMESKLEKQIERMDRR